MKGCAEWHMMNRRSFIGKTGLGMGALALADPVLQTVASTYGQTAGGSGDLLVLCQLNGGMDVLSFLAPFKNSVYQSKRPVLALGADDVTLLPDNSDYGINNLFPIFNELYAAGEVAIVQQVGYPDANQSHFESQEVFEFGLRNIGGGSAVPTKWYERLRKSYFDEPFGVLDTKSIGDPSRYGYPDNTYHGAVQDAFARISADKQMANAKRQAIIDAYSRINIRGAEIREKTADFESSGEIRGEFYRAAQLAHAGLGTQVIKLSYGGFDTHGSQDQATQDLFPRINDHFAQFVTDMKQMGMWDRTCVCFYTEFGRRNEENGSPGTDHGHGGHMVLVGPRVNGGLHGQAVTTADLNEPSLPYYVDFRAVFAACIQDWLGFDPKPVFEIGGETYDTNIGSSLFV